MRRISRLRCTSSMPSVSRFFFWISYLSSAEELNAARIVRVAVIQNAIVKPTTAPLKEQYEAIRDRVSEMIVAAAKCGTNVCCLQEAWSEQGGTTFLSTSSF